MATLTRRVGLLSLLALSLAVACGGDDDVGDPSACAAPGAIGNSLGVGMHCTPGGMECGDTGGAFLCTVDVRPDAPAFCTRLCGSHEDCGEDALCEEDEEESDGLRGCIPACLVE